MNTKHKNYKKYLRLEAKLAENFEAQRNLGYKPLDTPIHDGYQIEYVLRKDVAAREDAWLFEGVLEYFGKTGWCRDKSFNRYDKGSRKTVDITPYITTMTEREYETFIPAFQKLWEHSPSDDIQRWGWKEKVYKCKVPRHFFDTKISKHYKTHYKVIDEVLKQEEAELKDQINALSIDMGGKWYYKAPKPFRKIYNRKDRAYNKQALRENMNYLEPEFETFWDHNLNKEVTVLDCYRSWQIYWMDDLRPFKYHHKYSAHWDYY